MLDPRIGLSAVLCLILVPASLHAGDDSASPAAQPEAQLRGETPVAGRAEGLRHIEGLSVVNPTRIHVPMQVPANTDGGNSANQPEHNSGTAAR